MTPAGMGVEVEGVKHQRGGWDVNVLLSEESVLKLGGEGVG